MKKITVQKGQILQQKGDLNSKVYRVESGLLRSYIIDEKGKEHIFMFAPENWTIADYCLPEDPCELFIDVLETSTVLVLGKDPNMERANMQAFRKRMKVMQQRIIMMMSISAAERYEHFLKTYPNIVQRVPQRMIASFLGVTPEALSRVRKNSF